MCVCVFGDFILHQTYSNQCPHGVARCFPGVCFPPKINKHRQWPSYIEGLFNLPADEEDIRLFFVVLSGAVRQEEAKIKDTIGLCDTRLQAGVFAFFLNLEEFKDHQSSVRCLNESA